MNVIWNTFTLIDRCWQRFYSCCVQYHVASLKPLGLMLLPSVSGAVFLKKSTFSFLRPLDPLEHMTLSSDYADKDQFVNFALFSEGKVFLFSVLRFHKLRWIFQIPILSKTYWVCSRLSFIWSNNSAILFRKPSKRSCCLFNHPT